MWLHLTNLKTERGGWTVKGGGEHACRGETAATAAETYQNSSYILAQSLGLPED